MKNQAAYRDIAFVWLCLTVFVVACFCLCFACLFFVRVQRQRHRQRTQRHAQRPTGRESILWIVGRMCACVHVCLWLCVCSDGEQRTERATKYREERDRDTNERDRDWDKKTTHVCLYVVVCGVCVCCLSEQQTHAWTLISVGWQRRRQRTDPNDE